MKDYNKLKNYRNKYKRHFGIKFNENYVVHHIDMNRQNNDISNLILLPKELHEKYHTILNLISVCPQKTKADGFIDVRLSCSLIMSYYSEMFKLLPQVLEECEKWIMLKNYKYNKNVLQQYNILDITE